MLIIDRIEGEYAVCEKDDSSFINIHLSQLPSDVHEGGILKTNAAGTFYLDYAEEAVLREKISTKCNSLFE